MCEFLSKVKEASSLLRPQIRRTPLEECPALTNVLNIPVFLKLEFLQVTGSFKIRGALLRLATLSKEEKAAGVATCSAGNHGWAMAYASRKERVPVSVYVPSTIDPCKLKAIEALGGRVVKTRFPGYDAAERFARTEASRLGQVFVSPFDEEPIMIGNGGTLAQELVEDLPEIHTVITPVGGGGLAAGLSLFLKEVAPNCSLIACQHQLSPALKLSLERGYPVTEMPAIRTAAGGIEGGIGRETFRILRNSVKSIALLAEKEILEAVRWFMEEHHYLIEPSAAVGLAACLRGRISRLAGPSVIILTGRNVDLQTVRGLLM